MQETTGCKKCKQRDRRGYQWLMVVFGFYVIFSSIYGSIALIKEFLKLIK